MQERIRREREKAGHDAEELPQHSSLKGKRKQIASKGKARQSYAQDRTTTLRSLQSNLGFCETLSPPALYVKLYDSENRWVSFWEKKIYCLKLKCLRSLGSRNIHKSGCLSSACHTPCSEGSSREAVAEIQKLEKSRCHRSLKPWSSPPCSSTSWPMVSLWGAFPSSCL